MHRETDLVVHGNKRQMEQHSNQIDAIVSVHFPDCEQDQNSATRSCGNSANRVLLSILAIGRNHIYTLRFYPAMRCCVFCETLGPTDASKTLYPTVNFERIGFGHSRHNYHSRLTAIDCQLMCHVDCLSIQCGVHIIGYIALHIVSPPPPQSSPYDFGLHQI